MTYNKNYPKRKNVRLKEFDYTSENYYFVTICTDEKKNLFGMAENLSFIGKIAKEELLNIPCHYDGIQIENYVIMPNHIHMIIVIGCDNYDSAKKAERSRPFPTLSQIVGLYKSGVSKRVHLKYPNIVVWQKSFHDHIIRNEKSFQKITKYIDDNPITWLTDCYHN